ncbi:MAG TPA: hypothetical protein VKA48_13210, partial [Gammaproteobacteria bacterium]|nr:hypothetical protein [Gammaproteobacteria bacterium]
MHFRKLAGGVLVSGAGLLAMGSVHAAEPGPRVGIHVGLESFHWEEKDPSIQNRRLLKEDGPRLSAAVSYDNFRKPDEGL